ncbi:hypothetical protein FOF52_04565 [Thermobifida alba]|uniref:Uncharacterized protein n=1 Tax=Thermobifida alba TaxID=53522 RepID=A0ABY4KY28_THEAE|nr:hypothetical protein [Thermobifida alba]UPT20325.1 hypothetical protein FOF52_04565 [Thermobifida alba]
MGTSPVRLLVIDTDSALEQVDTLRSVYPGAPATGLNVHTSDLDAALRHPAIAVRQLGLDALGGACRPCSLRAVCGEATTRTATGRAGGSPTPPSTAPTSWR